MSKNALSTYARKIGQSDRLNITILLENHTPSTVYTTRSNLSGSVVITAPSLTPFDAVEISLEGTTEAYTESLATAPTDTRIKAHHNFLRLAMPIAPSSYPMPRALETDKTLTLPFNFVVPERLLPTSCAHATDGDHVQDAHLQLPPSMGDPQNQSLDDLAPDMTKVRYTVKVKVLRKRGCDSKKVVLSEASTPLTIIPIYSEDPPLNIEHNDKDYTLSHSRTLRKGVFAGKLGTISFSASQPSSISPATQATTIITLHVRFDPSRPSERPPRLGSLTTKLKSETFFAIHAVSSLPTRSSLVPPYTTNRGAYSYSMTLSSRNVVAVEWKRQESTPVYTRRDSGYRSMSSACTSTTSLRRIERKHELDSTSVLDISDPHIAQVGHYYTATIILPITLPPSKSWLPTFHSCLVSRIYTLECSLAVHVPGVGMPASGLVLKLPLQIASPTTASKALDQTVGQSPADSNSTPNLIGVVNETAGILPQYADLNGHRC